MRPFITLAFFLVALPLSAVEPVTKSIHVTLVGDSIAFGAGDEDGKGIAGRIAPELRTLGFTSVSTTNLGVTGATTSDVLARLAEKEARAAIVKANAIVVSAGANDVRGLFSGEETPRSPILIAQGVLRNLVTIVDEIRSVNANARIFIMGAYLPLANERAAASLEPLVALWDTLLVSQFADDDLVSVVRLSDIIDRPARLSREDSFHPGGEAYQATAKRIAAMLSDQSAD